MSTARTLSRTAPEAVESADQRILLHRISWEQYEALSQAVGDDPGIRTTYLEGELEIMSPGFQHESEAKLLARLVEAFAEARGLPLVGSKSETFHEKRKRAGLEPDECYRLGRTTGAPDLAIEVVVTSGSIEKLAVYRRLDVREVWFWEGGKLALHSLGSSGAYKRVRASRVLRGFPVAEVERILRETDPVRQTEAVGDFRRSLG